MTWIRAGVVAAAIAMVVSACGSGSEQAVKTVGLSQVAEASQASTARVEMSQEVQGQGSTTVKGELDFKHRGTHLRGDLGSSMRGASDADLKGLPPEIREQMMPQIEIFSSADEMIVVSDRGYLRAKGQWWDLGTMDGPDGSTLDPLSPTTMLDQLAHLGSVRTLGQEQVRGTTVTRYEAHDRKTGARYDVWVDGSGRAVRVTTTASHPEQGELARESMELFDFGAPVSIKAPTDAKPMDGGTAVNVDLHQIASGKEGNVSWRLSTGLMDDGRRCVKVETDPALDGEVVVQSPDGSGSTSGDVAAGQPTDPSCGPAPTAELGGSGAILLAVGGRTSDVHYLAGSLQPGAEVEVTFHDGHTEKLEGHDGAFVLFFSGHDWPKRMSGGNTTCDLQGDSTTSGTDSVC